MADFEKDELSRLQESMKFSKKKLKPFRENQLEALKEYVGNHYSDDGSSDRMPINLLELAVNVYVQHLAAERPNTLVTTKAKQLKPLALSLQIDTNGLLETLKFEETIYEAVMQAIFSVGIVKCGLNNSGTVLIDGQHYPIAEPFALPVSLDNWVHDMKARRWDQIQYCGDRYTVLFEDAKEDESLSKSFRDKLCPSEQSSLDESDQDKSESITQGKAEHGDDRYQDVVELWDIWLPIKGIVITIADDIDEVGRVIEWRGPSRGPYHFLSFNKVIDNIMPLPQVALWRDLNDLTNRLFRKLGRQSERQKTITGVQAGADEDGNRIVKADDGDVLKLDNPNATKEYKYGGIDQQSLLFLLQVKDLASYMYGNLDILAGLGRGSETVGQDQMLSASASKRLGSMQKKTIGFTTGIIEDIAWYRWTDPIRDYPVTKARYGTQIETFLTARDRETDFFRFNFEIEPFSMQHQTPSAKIAALDRIFQTYIAPFAQILASQGIFIDFESMLKTIASYGNLPELNDILIYADPQHPEETATGKSIRQSPVTTRRYIREGRPGPTNQGKDAILSQILAGGRPQRAELSMINQ